jgi:HlyD family secretion protein
MENNKTTQKRRGFRSFKTMITLVVVILVAFVIVWLKVVRGSEDPTSDLATFVAKRGPLTISVLESGTIQPQEQTTLKDEVEGRTSIVSLVPDGSMVKKGDLLVELDASTLNDAIIDQDIKVQQAEAAFVSAQENLAVIENQAKSDTEKAELTLKFARQDLDQYQKGSYPTDVNSMTAKIRLAEEQVTRAEDVNDWSKRLYKDNYLSKSEYSADHLSLEGKILDRDVAIADLDLLKNFTYHRQIEQLTSDVNQAAMALERTRRKASADVVQAQADLKAKDLELNRQKQKMQKYQDQLSKTKIYAPQDGMVVYATSSGSRPWDRRDPMEVGVEVSERQDLINLPTTSLMKAKVNIHETSLEKIHKGLPAVITVDALPGKKFLGHIESIAPLPDAMSMWMNPDLKIYPTDIYLDDGDGGLRTGMSCKAEIIIAQYEDAVYVPVQAVLRVGGKPTVFVVKDGSIEERQVEVGLDDNNVIRIVSGLKEGEVVLMTPPLKAGTIAPGARTAGAPAPNAVDVSQAMKDRVSQKLEEANGTAQGTPTERPAEQGPPQGPPSEQMQQMRQRLQNMSPEERQKAIEQFRERRQNTTPQEREQMRQHSQGRGSRRGGGQRPAGGQEPGQAQGPPASGRNQ